MLALNRSWKSLSVFFQMLDNNSNIVGVIITENVTYLCLKCFDPKVTSQHVKNHVCLTPNRSSSWLLNLILKETTFKKLIFSKHIGIHRWIFISKVEKVNFTIPISLLQRGTEIRRNSRYSEYCGPSLCQVWCSFYRINQIDKRLCAFYIQNIRVISKYHEVMRSSVKDAGDTPSKFTFAYRLYRVYMYKANRHTHTCCEEVI